MHVSRADVHDLKLLRPTLDRLAEEVLQKPTKNAVLITEEGYYCPEAGEESLRHGPHPRIRPRGMTYQRAAKAEGTQRA